MARPPTSLSPVGGTFCWFIYFHRSLWPHLTPTKFFYQLDRRMPSQHVTDRGERLSVRDGAATAATVLESRDFKVKCRTASCFKCEPSVCFWSANLRVLVGDLVVGPGVCWGASAGSGPPEVRGKPKRIKCSMSSQDVWLRFLTLRQRWNSQEGVAHSVADVCDRFHVHIVVVQGLRIGRGARLG